MNLNDNIFKKHVQAWFESEIKPNIQAWSEQDVLPIRALIKSLSDSELLVSGWTEPYGQNNIRKQLYLHYTLAQQPIGGIGLCLTSHIDIGARCLLEKGSQSLIFKWLPKALNGEAIFSLAMTEPDAGSDLQGIGFSAEQSDDGWVLNGTKRGITNLPFADVAIVLARTHPSRSPFSYSLFLVPLNTQGITREDALPTIGYEGCLGGFNAQQAVIPNENLIGQSGAGLIMLMQHLETERLFVSARMLGLAEHLFSRLLSLPNGKNNQAVKLKIELIAYQEYFEACVQNQEQKQLSTKDSAALKYMGSKLLSALTHAYSERSGLSGYLNGNMAERYSTEAMGLSLAGGSKEIMLSLIGDAL
ncbi:acyl-CoA dehydrogenase family protein [Catenovulum sp. SM1970]|uniref:acyl-CoA dehydrogenase family protein n=1 Tax=Marinifaba aquimaris TaxID=2741323 RepID=UPI0015730DC7|nr:acyl-CoA dehydrogenase family protein [Marinifaba aquimaris]NTS75298.1 acyl-CoA dehydrogenase family protein [Marinifaba aquimaris]